MAKLTVESSLVLDALELTRRGCLADGSRFRARSRQGQRATATLYCHVEGDCLHLDHVFSDTVTNDRHRPVKLSHTLTSFGAARVWFLCPACASRVRKLYLPPGAFDFRCRSCHELSYVSRQKRGYSTVDYGKKLEKLRLVAERLHRQAQANRVSEAAKSASVPLNRLSADLCSGPPEAAAPAQRPRGRPKVKRPYRRRKLFLTRERRSEGEGLCMRCRDYQELKSPRPVTLANGRPALKGTCPSCGATMILIVKGS